MIDDETLRRLTALEQRLAAIEDVLHVAHVGATTAADPTLEDAGAIQVASVDSRLIECDESWARMSWKIELRNPSNLPADVFVTVEFLDVDGFTLAEAVEEVQLAPGAGTAVRGIADLTKEVADRVESISASVAC